MTAHPRPLRDPLTPGFIVAIDELAAVGLDHAGIAQQLNLDLRTVERGWGIAAWLKRERFSIAFIPDTVQIRCRGCGEDFRFVDTALLHPEAMLYPFAQEHVCDERERRRSDRGRRRKFSSGDSNALHKRSLLSERR